MMCRILFTGLIAAMIGAALLGVTVSASDPWEGYEERPEISEREYEFIEGKVNIVAGKIEAEPGARVEFPVYIQNNTETGFTASEIKIFFDKELSVDLDAHAVPRGRMGEAANAAGLTSGRSFNSDENIVTLSTLGTESITDDGLFFTVSVIVPEHNPKHKYPVTVDVVQLNDNEENPVPYVSLDGYITYFPFYTEQTSTAEPGTTTTDLNTTTTVSGSSAGTSLTTAAAETTAAVTTTKPASTGTSAAKTGDAGTGAAAAAFVLALAAGATAKKKHRFNIEKVR